MPAANVADQLASSARLEDRIFKSCQAFSGLDLYLHLSRHHDAMRSLHQRIDLELNVVGGFEVGESRKSGSLD